MLYGDPEVVAQLMYRRLQARPRGRLAFNEAALPEIVAAFGNQRKQLRRIGHILVEQTIAGLKEKYAAEPLAS